MVFGPIGRLLAPGTVWGSLWAFDFLIFFGLLIRIHRTLPIYFGRDILRRVSTPGYFVIFSLVGLIGSFFVFPWPTVLKGGLYTIRWLAYYLVTKVMRKRKDIKGELLIIGAILAVLGFLQLWLLPDISPDLVRRFAFDPHVGRLFSTWFDPNYLGGFLVLALLLNLGKKGEIGKKGIIGGLILIGIVLTFSRSSWLALLVGLLVYFAFKSPKVILAVVSLALMAILLISPVRERAQGALDLDITARQRILNWQNAWQIIKSNPIVGVGYNLYEEAGAAIGQRFKKENMPYLPAAHGSDSSLLTIWATAGLGGLLVYLLLFWQIFKLGTLAEKSALSALLIHSLFVNSLLLPPFMIVFWLILNNLKCQISNVKSAT